MFSFKGVSVVTVSLHNNRNPNKNTTLFQLCVVFYCSLLTPVCAIQALFGMVPTPGIYLTSLKKTDCPSSRSHKLSITSRLGVGAHGPLLHVRMLIGFFLYRSCADSHSCYEFMSTVALSHSEDSVSLWSSVNSDFYNLTTALWVVVPEP